MLSDQGDGEALLLQEKTKIRFKLIIIIKDLQVLQPIIKNLEILKVLKFNLHDKNIHCNLLFDNNHSMEERILKERTILFLINLILRN